VVPRSRQQRIIFAPTEFTVKVTVSGGKELTYGRSRAGALVRRRFGAAAKNGREGSRASSW
jgi:hypothetical protein